MKHTGVFMLLLALALLAAGCTEPLIRPEGGTGNHPASSASPADPANTPPSGGEAKTFTVQATKYAFDLREIRVKQGETVTIELDNVKGYHTLKLEGYNLEAKKNRPITFVATEKGEFEFRCGIVCGHGHDGMTGKLIVE